MSSLPKTVTRQRRDCDLNPGPSAPESSALTTRLPSHVRRKIKELKSDGICEVCMLLRCLCCYAAAHPIAGTSGIMFLVCPFVYACVSGRGHSLAVDF